MLKKNSAYQKGYKVELKAKERLENMGALVIRSSKSRTPIDLIAIFPFSHEIWLIQAKKKEVKNLSSVKEAEILKELEGEYKVRSFVFAKKNHRYYFFAV